jgi:hypothetical protein
VRRKNTKVIRLIGIILSHGRFWAGAREIRTANHGVNFWVDELKCRNKNLPPIGLPEQAFRLRRGEAVVTLVMSLLNSGHYLDDLGTRLESSKIPSRCQSSKQSHAAVLSRPFGEKSCKKPQEAGPRAR